MPSLKPNLTVLFLCLMLVTLVACAPVTTREIKQYEDRGNIEKLIHVVKRGDKPARIKAIRALGELGDPRAVNTLSRALQSDSWVERESAVIALGKINDYLSIKPLVSALSDKDQFVRERAAKVLKTVSTNLARAQNTRVTNILFGALESGDEYTRNKVAEALQGAIDALVENYKPYFISQLMDELSKPNRYVRREAARALGKFNDPRVVSPLLSAQKDPDPQVQLVATEALLRIKNPQSVKSLITALASEDSNIREDAVDALKKFTQPAEVSEMLQALHSRNPRVREGIVNVLSELKQPDVIQALKPLLKDNVASIRKATANALQNMGWQPKTNDEKAETCVALQDWDNCASYSDAAIKPLLFAMRDNSPEIRSHAAAVLVSLNWTPQTDEEKGIACVMRQDWDGCIKLGKPAINALVRGLDTQSVSIKQSIIATLAQINDIDAIRPLVFALNTDDAVIRVSIVNALGKFIHPLAMKTLLHALDDNNYYVRQAAFSALQNNMDAYRKTSMFDVRTPLLNALRDNNRNVRLAAAKLLGDLQDPETIDALIDTMTDQDRDVRESAADSMSKIKSPDAIPPLVAALKNKHPEIRIRILRALAEFKDNRAIEPLIDAINDTNDDVKIEVIKILGKINDPRTIPALIRMLGSDNIDIEHQTILSLANKNDPSIIAPIKHFLTNDKARIREAAGMALVKLNWKPSTKDEEGINCVIRHDWIGCEKLGKYAVSALITELRDPESRIREESARTLGLIGDKRAIQPLIKSIEMTQWTGNKDENKILLGTVEKALSKFEYAAVPEMLSHMSDWYTGYYLAQVLKDIGWVPQNDKQVVHYHVALRDREKLLANWAVTKKVLITDIASVNVAERESALFAFIGLGKTESITPLINALENNGSVSIAEAYLNSGNDQLMNASISWTNNHNLEVNKYSRGNHPISWGKM